MTPKMISAAVGQINPRVHSTNDEWLGLSSAWTCRLGVLVVLSGVFSWRTGSWAELFLDKFFDPIRKADPQGRHGPRRNGCRLGVLRSCRCDFDACIQESQAWKLCRNAALTLEDREQRRPGNLQTT